MNNLDSSILQKANEEAVYNIYLYLLHYETPNDGQALEEIVQDLKAVSHKMNNRDIYRLNIIKNAIKRNPSLAKAQIRNLVRKSGGLTACSFTLENGDSSVVFKGTGSGEWIDNGEGLSGIPEKQVYLTYDKNGNELYQLICEKAYATDQQVEALNWFNKIYMQNGWNKKVTVSGHSKGGNKAQFIAINSDLVDNCYSFSGQGFSPEAISSFKKDCGESYEARRSCIMSFSADNDYVSVLGSRLVPKENIYYFKPLYGLHFIDAIFEKNGALRPQTNQGKLSAYIESVSNQLMRLNASSRQYATVGVMNIFQKFLGDENPAAKDRVSIEKTIAGITIAANHLLRNI